MTPRKVAMGLLVISVLALAVGLFNAAKITIDEAAKPEKGKKVASLINKEHLSLIELSGMIVMDSSDDGLFSSESNAVQVRKALDEAAEDDSVAGILLRINSPGGTVGMSQELNAAVQRASKKKPVVASLGDLAASGGYYTACAADKIVANRGTLTASIGVIISSMNLSDLLNNKLGVKPVTIKSGKFKDVLSPYRPPSAEEMTLIQDMVNDSYQDFLNAVIAGRTRFITDPAEKKNRIARIREVADGRVVHGQEAMEAGLVDEIGDFEAAYTLLDQMAKERSKGRLKGKDRLPLKSRKDSFNLMEYLGLPVAKAQVPALSTQDMVKELMPMSMRYPNQPLWVME